ncbi:ABC transporter ATP-binding protein [Pseudomarimonas arenosa]|uniref:ABC transporter ATP-binding protein n=1 Tax=Pseudomarimonas arenosa TaxID=2774145 RepID=A0AAW3ZFF3_9GAMM|nr:ATP-binding cassette domain-containing protein [Pseudomarimonas arenosa]MBD8524895.1 ABC transporter ATP-binding protein [Pseudomarimonas arenosa]
MSDSAIRLCGVGVAFPMQRRLMGQRFWALDHIDLDLKHGNKLGVIGRNGAGKSTLLRVLAGAIEPDRGEIIRCHGSIQLLAINLGFVHYLTGRDNAILSGLLQGFDRRTIESKLERIAEFSGLGRFFDQPINTYSSGMVSRLGFSLAMQLEPDVLLIDETLSVGDAEFREKSSKALREKFDSDQTVVLVSHNDSTLSRLCDRLLWVEHGRSIMLGPADEVLESYRRSNADEQPPSRDLPLPSEDDEL